MATILDLGDPNLSLPEFLLLDASILLEVRSVPGVSLSPRGTIATQFLRRMQQACLDGNTIPLVCPLTLEECYFKIIQWQYMNDPSLGAQRATIAATQGKQPNRVSWHDLYKSRPQQISYYVPALQAFFQWVIAIPLTVLEPRDLVSPDATPLPIEEQMRNSIQSCCILPRDAYLVAIADRLGVYHIATLDKDFERLGTEFTVYTLP
jgi:hypothetical protein